MNDAIQDLDPSIHVISEPGQYYVTSAFTLASYLHSKKVVRRGGKIMRMYYVNCGVYNSFIEEMLGLKARHPQFVFEVIHAFFTNVVRIPRALSLVNIRVIADFYCCSRLAMRNSFRLYGGRPATRTMSFLRMC